jgi:hypothetical protein
VIPIDNEINGPITLVMPKYIFIHLKGKKKNVNI